MLTLDDNERFWAKVDRTGKRRVFDAKGYKTQIYRLKKRMAALLLGIEIEEC